MQGYKGDSKAPFSGQVLSTSGINRAQPSGLNVYTQPSSSVLTCQRINRSESARHL